MKQTSNIYERSVKVGNSRAFGKDVDEGKKARKIVTVKKRVKKVENDSNPIPAKE